MKILLTESQTHNAKLFKIEFLNYFRVEPSSGRRQFSIDIAFWGPISNFGEGFSDIDFGDQRRFVFKFGSKSWNFRQIRFPEHSSERRPFSIWESHQFPSQRQIRAQAEATLINNLRNDWESSTEMCIFGMILSKNNHFIIYI